MHNGSRFLRFLPFLLITLIGILFQLRANASHSFGGNFSYVCLGNNQFRITLTLYQDCLGNAIAIEQDNPAWYAIYTKDPVPVLVLTGNDSAATTEIIPPNFSNDCINNFPTTCLRKQVFIFTVTLPPTDVGYTLVYQRCCRNGTIVNVLNSGMVGVTYSADIPPFKNGECSNNSAVFKNPLPQIICENNPFTYDFSAIDPDGDSLSYELCAAHEGASTMDPLPMGAAITPPPFNNIPYVPPYSYQDPIPGNPGFSIDPHTGLMTGNPIQIGRYIITVCVHEWRDGEIINTLSQDMQFIITDCSKKVSADIPELPNFPNVYQIHCEDYTVHFVSTSTGAFTYFWDFGVPGATSTDSTPTFTYPDTGTYVVKLVVNRGTTCSDSIERLVKVYPFFNAGFTYSGTLCPGEPIQFTDTTTTTIQQPTNWSWNFRDGSPISNEQNPIHDFPKPGGPQRVTLTVSSILGCIDSATVIVPIDHFDVFAGNDTTIVLNYPYSLHGSGAEQYHWTPSDYLSDPNVADPTVHFPDVGNYTYVLHGTSSEGCSGTDTIHIIVVDAGTVFIPSGFTPNGDGLNDLLEPITVGYSSINFFRIYNRYGQLVYGVNRDNKPQWDGKYNGKACEMGTYFWSINVTDAFGAKETKSGSVNLIR